ncbi:MAG: HAD family hydrolase [Caulobacteraceae bacterium]
MFDAVIFDCDGCLIDSEVLALEVELAALADAGMIYDREDFCRRFMGLTDDAFFAALDADRLAALGGPLPADFRREHDAKLTRAVDERLAEVAGAAAAVAALGRRKAVASSSHAAFLERKLRRAGLWEAFAPHVYAGDQVARGKPAPDLFRLAAAGLGVAADRCLVIEDSVNGVLAGRAAGMTVWALAAGGHIRPGDIPRLRQAGAHAIVGAWSEAARDFAAWG